MGKNQAKKIEEKMVRTIDQLSLGRMIAQKFGLKISDVMSVIEEEQKLTMEHVRMGYKVIKKNYLTIESKKFSGKKDWKCPLDGKTYSIEPKNRVLVRVGEGFKQFVGDKKMPEKLCRFVNNQAEIGS